MKIEIKHRWNFNVLFSYECEGNTEKITLEAGIKSGADLSGADLYEADLRGANLSGADLSGAYLRGADLLGADLRGANLYGANLREAKIDCIEIPTAEQAGPLLAQVAAAALATPEALSMGAWHTCETSHCIAGWACTLAGERGKELERKFGPENAGMILLGVEAATHFYDDYETAHAWLETVK